MLDIPTSTVKKPFKFFEFIYDQNGISVLRKNFEPDELYKDGVAKIIEYNREKEIIEYVEQVAIDDWKLIKI